MAVGKGSMARASKAVKTTEAKDAVKEVVKETPVTVEEKKEEPEKKVAAKKPAKKPVAKKTPAKKAEPKSAVIAGTSEQVMQQIVYQKSSQMLERDAKPNESFYIGDDMPVYFY